jgi:protocatechuate 3,4-dioxygenase beta subunit
MLPMPTAQSFTNAAVQITDQATNLSRDATTNSEGNYEVAALKPGKYKVTVTAAGSRLPPWMP